MVDTREVTTPTTPGVPDGIATRIDTLERQFAALYNAYRQQMRQRSDDIDPALQPSGYRTLVELVVGGPTGARDLAEALGFDKSVLSRQLHQLEELGLVTREQDPSDRRAVIISATPEAVARILAIRGHDRDAFRARLSTWPRADLDDLTRLLTALYSR